MEDIGNPEDTILEGNFGGIIQICANSSFSIKLRPASAGSYF